MKDSKVRRKGPGSVMKILAEDTGMGQKRNNADCRAGPITQTYSTLTLLYASFDYKIFSVAASAGLVCYLDSAFGMVYITAAYNASSPPRSFKSVIEVSSIPTSRDRLRVMNPVILSWSQAREH